MARGTALSTLRTMLKAELQYSLDSTATGKDTALNQLLASKELWLASEFDWPFLEHRWDVTVNAGGRFINFPTTESSVGDEGASVAINFEREVRVETKYNSKWWPMDYGIGAQEFNIFDSDLSITMDPIMRWRFATDASEAASPNQFEVWPMPVTSQTVRFTGQRALIAMSSDSDKADLDDNLIVLFCAAEQAAVNQMASAQLLANRAQERLKKVLGSYPERTRRLVLGRSDGRYDRKRVRTVPLVAVHG
jgi:hypothetical protein